MANQDFTNTSLWKEYDVSACVTVAENLLTVAGDNNTPYSVHRVYDEDHFSGDFLHKIAVRINSDGEAGLGFAPSWGMSNETADAAHSPLAVQNANGDFLYVAFYEDTTPKLYLREIIAGSSYEDYGNVSYGTWYWLEVERDEATGTYGTLLCRIYSDESRTSLVDTLSVTLHEKEDFRTLYACASYYSGDENPHTLLVKDFDLGVDATGAVEFPALTADGEAEKLTGYLTFDSYENKEAMTVTADTVTITDAQIGHQYRLTKDLGAAYFDGNFTHTVQAKFTRGSTGYWRGAFWGVANAALDFQLIDTTGGYALWLGAEGNNSSTWCIRLTECHAGTLYTSAWAAAANDTDYYCTITRNESVGTYGTLYAYIYSDAARTDLLATLSVTLHSKQDFRYLHGANSNCIPFNTNTYSARFKDLDFGYHSYVAATGAVEFPLLACEADVNTPYKGIIGAFEFPLLTSEGAVVLTHTGTGEPSFPLLTSEGAGTPHWFFGPGEVTFPLLSSDGSVHVNPKHATGAPEFPLLTASGTVIRPIRGAGAVTFPLLEADGGQIIKDTATGAATFPAAIAAGAAKRKVTGTGEPEFPLLEADTVAAKTITATGTPTLPAARTKGYSLDYDKHAGSGMPTLPAARASGRAALYSLRTATGAATLPAARAKGAGTDYDALASAGTPALPAARAKGKATVYRLRTATGAVTFRLLTADGTGTSKRIDGGATFGALTADGTARRTIAATGAPEFPALTSSTSGQRVYTGTGDVTFAAALAEGAAGRTISASCTITFPALTADGIEYRIVYGEGAPEFEALEASTTTARTVYASGAPSFPVPYGGMHMFNATERALQWYRVVQIQYIGNEPYKRAKLEAVRAPVMR